MKKFIAGFLSGAILFGTAGAFAVTYIAQPAGFKVLVNGKEFQSDPPALEVEGRTYLPLRAMGEALGVPVNWNEELNQAEVGNSAPVAEKGQYSRNNPAPLNTVQKYTKTSKIFEEDNYTVSIRVMETVRGEKAYDALNDKLLPYPKPDEGYEYMNVKIAFSVNETKEDVSVNVSDYGFDAFSSNNEESPSTYLASVEPNLQGSLYAGGNTEGWITVQVKKDDKAPKLAYGLDYNGAGGLWFALQ